MIETDSPLTRFLEYVTIDTQSDPTSDSFPSTAKQFNLAKRLQEELLQLGLEDVELDAYGYVYATLPSNLERDVPTICFCSHMDTSSDVSGANVQPIVHRNYQGGNIELPNGVTLTPENHPELKNQVGNDIVTASGTTLLGADNKAGLAEIMSAVAHLIANPKIPHGKIRILFTPDEEIGKGTAHVDMQKLGADFGYTVDGETAGTLQEETFSADKAVITIRGVSAHPGFAKGKLVNAIKIAAEILDELPKTSLSPETTDRRDGFVHPTRMSGIAEHAQIEFIVRDFDKNRLLEHEKVLADIVEKISQRYPRAEITLAVSEQYRNMKEVLDQHPEVVAKAKEAIRRAGMEPVMEAIRGGTDGSRLSFMGLPCPNLFTGGHGFHSREEWISVQDMLKARDVIVQLAAVLSE
jgi:tripeptide aminopeptidase